MSESLNKKWQDPWAFVQKLKERNSSNDRRILDAEEKLKRGDVPGATEVLRGLPESVQCLGCDVTEDGTKEQVPDQRYKPHFLGGPEPAAEASRDEKTEVPKRRRATRPRSEA